MENDSGDFGQSRLGFLLLHQIGIHLSASCQLSRSCRSNEESVCGNLALRKTHNMTFSFFFLPGGGGNVKGNWWPAYLAAWTL